MNKLTTIGFLAASLASAADPYKIETRFPAPGNGGWDYVTLDAANQRLYLSHATRVEVLSAADGKVIGSIPDTPGVHGIAIANGLKRGYTSNGKESKVSVFDLDTLKVTGKIAVGEEPDGIYFDAASGRVFTNNHGTHDITAIDAKSGKVVGTVKADGDGEQAVIGPDGLIYVNLEDKAAVLVFDPKTLEVKHRFPIVGCEGPTGLAMDVKNARIFSACHNKMLVVMNSSNGKKVASFPIGASVDWAEFDTDGRNVLTSNGEGTLSVIHQKSADEYDAPIAVKTQASARTMALDQKRMKIYMPAADVEMIPAADGKKAQRKMKPGSFTVLVLGKA